MLQSCFAVLAFVSLAFTPPLAANNGLLNNGGSANVAASYVSVIAPRAAEVVIEAPIAVEAVQTMEAVEVAATVESAPAVVEAIAPNMSSFTDAEREALASLSLTDAQITSLAGADGIVIGLGGILVLALIVIIILILLDVISLDGHKSNDSVAGA